MFVWTAILKSKTGKPAKRRDFFHAVVGKSFQEYTSTAETVILWKRGLILYVYIMQVRRESEPLEGGEHILALNKHGVHFLDLLTHETILHYPYTEVGDLMGDL